LKKKLTSVVSSSEIVSSVFFAGDELFRVEELSVGTGTNFIDDGGFEIYEDGAWNVFAGTSFAEECVECIVCYSNGGITVIK
jgi:hypothetical protein